MSFACFDCISVEQGGTLMTFSCAFLSPSSDPASTSSRRGWDRYGGACSILHRNFLLTLMLFSKQVLLHFLCIHDITAQPKHGTEQVIFCIINCSFMAMCLLFLVQTDAQTISLSLSLSCSVALFLRHTVFTFNTPIGNYTLKRMPTYSSCFFHHSLL